MKLFLLSHEFTNKLFNRFVKLVGKQTNKIKIVVVPTAGNYKGKNYMPTMARDQLVDLGILKKNTKILELDHKVSYAEISDFDAVLVGGGNTFYLLHQIKKFGFDKVIKRFLKEDGVYVGISAGSIVMAPNIKIAQFGDYNIINLKDLDGLNYVDSVIAPHFDNPAYVKIITTGVKSLRKEGYKVITLKDSQGLLVIDDKKKVI